MRKIEIEFWAIRILESVIKNGPAEDHFVELKSMWLPARQVARRLAGHANSAPNDFILWLIGVNEKTGEVCGVQQEELASWWSQVEAEFADRVVPEMIPLNMRWENIPICALAFRTDRAPYVVRNPDYGSVAGHNIAWEIPIRRGTRVDTASRNQLISLLTPLLHLPRHEIRGAELILWEPVRKDKWVQNCNLNLYFYLILEDLRAFTLDERDCEATIEFSGYKDIRVLTSSSLFEMPLRKNEQGGWLTTINDTCFIKLKFKGEISSLGTSGFTEGAHITIRLRPVGYEQVISMSCFLKPEDEQRQRFGDNATHYFQL